MAESFQQIEAVMQVVTVNDDGVKFTTRQQIGATLQLRTALQIDRNLLQCGAQHAQQLWIAADEERFQVHGFPDLTRRRGSCESDLGTEQTDSSVTAKSGASGENQSFSRPPPHARLQKLESRNDFISVGFFWILAPSATKLIR